MFDRLLRAVIATALSVVAGSAVAQSAYCDRLRTELAGVERAAATSGSSQTAASITRLQSELDRTMDYARSIGCQNQRRFVLFGGPSEPQCRQLEGQINRLESTLAALEAEAGRSATGSLETRRSALIAAIDANCRTAGGGGGPRGLFDLLFGGGQGPMSAGEMPDTPLESQDFGAGSRTICVRKCDGFFFPVSSNANSSRYGIDADLCRAACPNAETALFIQPVGQDLDTAVSIDGMQPYTALPNAFKYRKSFDAACSCRRQGQSWSEALAEAEKVLAVNGRSDAIVTEQRSLELSRPRTVAPPPARAPQPGTRTAAAPGAPAPTVLPGAPGSAVAPTGQTVESVGPDGKLRTIRVITPSAGTTAPQPVR